MLTRDSSLKPLVIKRCIKALFKRKVTDRCFFFSSPIPARLYFLRERLLKLLPMCLSALANLYFIFTRRSWQPPLLRFHPCLWTSASVWTVKSYLKVEMAFKAEAWPFPSNLQSTAAKPGIDGLNHLTSLAGLRHVQTCRGKPAQQ